MSLIQQTILTFVVFALAQWNIPRFVVSEPFPSATETKRGLLTKINALKVYRFLIFLSDGCGVLAATFAWVALATANFYSDGGGAFKYVHPSQAMFSFYFISLLAHAGVRFAISLSVWQNLHASSNASIERVLAWLFTCMFIVGALGCFASQTAVIVDVTELGTQLCGQIIEHRHQARCLQAVVALSSVSSPIWLVYAATGSIALASLIFSAQFSPLLSRSTARS
jgi:hypothetical protein